MEHVLYDAYTMEIQESGTREEMIEALNREYQDGYDVTSLDDWRSEAHELFEEVWNDDLDLYDKIDIIQDSLGYDLQVYDNDEEFFDLFYSMNPYEAVTSALYGDYRVNDDYVTFDGYENLVSLNKGDLEHMVDDYKEEFIEYRIDEIGW